MKNNVVFIVIIGFIIIVIAINYSEKQSSKSYSSLRGNNISVHQNLNSQRMEFLFSDINNKIRSNKYYIVTNTLNVRRSSSTSGEIIGQFSPGQTIFVVGFEGEWAKVNVLLSNQNTVMAFVHSKYLRLINYTGDSNNAGTGQTTYQYSVNGYGNDGYVWGEISVDKYGGDGYIIDPEGNRKLINVDWTGKGNLEGYDEDGEYYELEVDK